MTPNESSPPRNINVREVDETAFERLLEQDIDPVMARIYAARGIRDSRDLDTELKSLLGFADLQK